MESLSVFLSWRPGPGKCLLKHHLHLTDHFELTLCSTKSALWYPFQRKVYDLAISVLSVRLITMPEKYKQKAKMMESRHPVFQCYSSLLVRYHKYDYILFWIGITDVDILFMYPNVWLRIQANSKELRTFFKSTDKNNAKHWKLLRSWSQIYCLISFCKYLAILHNIMLSSQNMLTSQAVYGLESGGKN